MSNVAIAHPNRLLEQKALHYKSSDWNTALPLENILTDVLPETARTVNLTKKTSFGISLAALPYRNLSAIALVNHNLSTSAKVKFTVFNEPPLCYATGELPLIGQESQVLNFTTWSNFDTTGFTTSTKLRLYPLNKNRAYYFDELVYVKANFNSYDAGTNVLQITVTSHSLTSSQLPNHANTNTCGEWIVVFDEQVGKTEGIITNSPQWLDCWQRIYPTDSHDVTWRSRNFWRGTIELEIMELVTKVHISFLKTNDGSQPLGTHLHIDIDDSQEGPTWNDQTINPDYSPYIEIGRVFMGGYMEATINPEYGSITHGVKDSTEFQQSDSGQKFFHEKSRARTVTVQWNHLDKDEAFGNILLSQLQQGISREVLYTYSVEKIDNYQLLQSFIGRYVDLSPIQQPNVGLYSANINLEEIL